MKTKPKINTSPGHCANLVLAAGANVSTVNEAHGLEGFLVAGWMRGLQVGVTD